MVLILKLLFSCLSLLLITAKPLDALSFHLKAAELKCFEGSADWNAPLVFSYTVVTKNDAPCSIAFYNQQGTKLREEKIPRDQHAGKAVYTSDVYMDVRACASCAKVEWGTDTDPTWTISADTGAFKFSSLNDPSYKEGAPKKSQLDGVRSQVSASVSRIRAIEAVRRRSQYEERRFKKSFQVINRRLMFVSLFQIAFFVFFSLLFMYLLKSSFRRYYKP